MVNIHIEILSKFDILMAINSYVKVKFIYKYIRSKICIKLYIIIIILVKSSKANELGKIK